MKIGDDTSEDVSASIYDWPWPPTPHTGNQCSRPSSIEDPVNQPQVTTPELDNGKDYYDYEYPYNQCCESETLRQLLATLAFGKLNQTVQQRSGYGYMNPTTE
ncbi:unnamed protein product [Dibothriocephalus latus]|uniref:Uncharacterized protein n=1 Tax=Dibothriocephalus latus TaxID=60516 RepID=A0A3P6QKH5_DIBLA|nr:unnamed protein product [Dibothriocephalus latus]